MVLIVEKRDNMKKKIIAAILCIFCVLAVSVSVPDHSRYAVDEQPPIVHVIKG